MTVELLALYGDDRELGFSLRKMRRRVKRAAGKALKYGTVPGLAITAASALKKRSRRKRRLRGDERFTGEAQDGAFVELLGGKKKKKKAKKKKRFLPGLSKAVKKVGKTTSGFTTGLAKMVGVPDSMLKALSKMDPTKGKKASATKAVMALTDQETGKEIVPVAPGAMNIDAKKIALIGGGAVASLIVLKLLLSSNRR